MTNTKGGMTPEEWEFHRVVNEGLLPPLRNSAVCVTLAPSTEELDAKFCVELGAMILLNKPILVICAPGQAISPKLEMVADKIVHADIGTDAGQALLHEAIADFGIQFPETTDTETP